MKENYLQIILVLLIAVIIMQGYYLYDLSSSKHAQKEVPIYLNQRAPLLFDAVDSMDDFFDKHKNPFVEMGRLRRQMEDNFRDIENYFQVVPSFNKYSLESYRIPRFDMKEQKGKYIITMEIPGSLSNAIKTEVEDGRLSVSAKILEEKDDNTTNYHRHERYARAYKHEMILPDDADVSSLQKEYKDGLLIVTINKKSP
ncbi:MAG: Hsp20/alpha crystallin family protein [Helicobacteraceae bacterium]|nr:Hsp20/alpha crystallin family protein [Candidatus Sulfurimonas ponti]